MGPQPDLPGLGPGIGEAGGVLAVLILAMTAMKARRVLASSSLYVAPLPLGPLPLGLSSSSFKILRLSVLFLICCYFLSFSSVS